MKGHWPMTVLEAQDHPGIFTSHAYPERAVDLGEIRMNYVTAGRDDLPALVLVPGQSQSWWSYEEAMPLLAASFRVYAVDLRGQGRSTWTPGRYSLDNMGNDLVRFLDLVVGRPAIVSGNSSGGLLAAWLSAFAKPGQLRGALLEDAPLFAAEVTPSCGQSIRQAIGPMFALWNKWLGDQWTIGDWAGMRAAMPKETPPWLLTALIGMAVKKPGAAPPDLSVPPQNMREYDPEWGRAFYSGTATMNCDHAHMLSSARVPMLYTHHFRAVDAASGALLGAASDEQVARARELVTGAGQPFEVVSLPEMAHSMHGQDPRLFTKLLTDWVQRLGTP
jgi:pimeloyl-ACP methyl ester carboxylesterase